MTASFDWSVRCKNPHLRSAWTRCHHPHINLTPRTFALIAGNDSILDVNNTVSISRDIVLVRYQDDCIAFRLQAVEQSHDFVARLGVEISGGLVSQDDGRGIYQSACNGDALPLAGRSLI